MPPCHQCRPAAPSPVERSALANAADFEERLERAVAAARVVLGEAKRPLLAAGAVHHDYEDKYLLAECLVNAGIASQLNCLQLLGLTPDALGQLQSWALARHTVSLRFRASEMCTFSSEEPREVEGPKVVEEVQGLVDDRSTTTRIVTTVTEYVWSCECSYELLAVRGVGAEAWDRVLLSSGSGNGLMKTTGRLSPCPDHAEIQPEDADISWLLQAMCVGASSPAFRVDRRHAECRTPRRNPDVQAALGHFDAFFKWAKEVSAHLRYVAHVDEIMVRQPLDWRETIDVGDVLVPVLPLLRDAGTPEAPEERQAQEAQSGDGPSATALSMLKDSTTGESGALLYVTEVNRLLADELRGLREKRLALDRRFQDRAGVVSAADAALAATLAHCCDVCEQLHGAVDYIEAMLARQLAAAISKEVTPSDLADYMSFHNRRLFDAAFAPKPFSFLVRRTAEHNPEGTVSIERAAANATGLAEPISTSVAQSDSPQLMRLPLSAATSVIFGGDRYLHAWLAHRFSGEAEAKLSLVCRAKQFCSFIVLVGRIVSATVFDPKYAAIVRNKDEVNIPLELSTIPTAKEFKDAIESLSPEQQGFARAFRAMQLQSTLFGVAVIQVRPQLERVLNLPGDALTKDIRLTQEIMDLFITHQIPSDILAFDGSSDVPGHARVEVVRGRVAAVLAMLDEARAEEIEKAKRAEAERLRAAAEEAERAEAEMRSAELELETEDRGAQSVLRRGGRPQRKECRARSPMPVARSRKVAAPSTAAAPASAPVASRASAPASQSTPASHETTQPEAAAGEAEALGAVDFTQVPQELERRFDALGSGDAARPTIISVGERWTKMSQRTLLARPTSCSLSGDELKREMDSARDLLDALTKSGALPVEHADLHVVLAATHCFDKTVVETVVQDNVNPIEKVERSMLLMASTVHRKPVSALIRGEHLDRVMDASPELLSL